MSEIGRPVYESYRNRRIDAATLHQTREIDQPERIIAAIARYTLPGLSGNRWKAQGHPA
jgi:hypothetical protein